ncbi:MAG: cytochrome c4 [Hyphomicrobiales bacterium]|nr:cytochrome c4 [Hyphomicrobiales bacterium]
MLRIALAAALAAGPVAAFADTVEEKAAVCAACHGANGVPADKSIPIIWGQNEGYLYLDFRDLQKGARKDDRMTPIALSFGKEDALALAEYFSQKPWPNLGAPAAPKADEQVAIGVNKSVVCTSCHLEEYQGDSSVPRLAGQQRDYLLKAMTDFRNRTRANNPGMSDLMNSVTPEQLEAMASYLAGF